MKLIKTEIAESAGKIISESGLEGLTTKELANKMGVDQELLYIYFRNNADIVIFMLLSLEYEIKVLINESKIKNLSSEKEFQLLFENIFNLFDRKPYYLSIIFSVESNDKVSKNHEILIRIKKTIDSYLLKILNKGKKETIFKTNLTPGTLVNRILGSFRSFMSQQNIINKMVKDLGKIRDNPDYI